MRAVSGAAPSRAKENDRPIGSATDQMVEDVLTDIAKSLWRKNTAASLAAELGCSVRTVERYMEGSREWSGEAIAAIVQEILARHRMRNVRVTSRQ